MDETFEVIVSGHLCLDLIPSMAHVPLHELATPSRLFEVGELSLATGGAVSNTGQALHRLGINVRLMALVGDDLLGRVIIAALKERDPRLSEMIAIQPGEVSSYTVVLTPQNADRIFLHCTGTNRIFGQAHIDFSLLEKARLFHLGYPPALPRLTAHNGAELEAVYRRAKETGVVTSMDMSVPDPEGASGRLDWAAILRRTLPHVDIFVPSIDEILFMLRRQDFAAWRHDVLSHLRGDYLSELAEEVIGLGAVIAGFKLGRCGLYLKTASPPAFARLSRLPLDVDTWADQQAYAPAFKVNVAGTTGAGDAAYAGLLAALLWGKTPAETARWGCAVGACNVEAVDAVSGIRTAPETQARLDAGWPTLETRIPGL